MPFPTPPYDIFYPARNPHPEALAPFAAYCWFRVAGFAEAHSTLNTRGVQNDMINQYRKDGVEHLPDELKSLNIAELDFTRISPKQIKRALTSPMRLDKACLALAVLDRCAQDHLPDVNILERTWICPAIYVVDGFDPVWQRLKQDDDCIARIKRDTLQPETHFFDNLARGFGVTYQTAESIVRFCEKEGVATSVQIREITNRHYDGKHYGGKPLKKTPNPSEIVPIKAP